VTPRTRSTSILAALVLAVALALAGCAADDTADGDDASDTSTGQTAGPTTTVPSPTLADQPYAGPQSSPAQVLDLWLPTSAAQSADPTGTAPSTTDATATPVPLVVFIHGGGWVEGDKDQVRSKLPHLLAAGFAVASIDYRLSEEAPFPAAPQDAKAAIRWLRANSPDLGIDPTRIAAWGESAGANLAALLGVTSDQQTLFDDPDLGNAATSAAVQAVVDWFGPTDLLQMRAQAANDDVCADPYDHDADDSYESRWLGEPLQSDIEVAELADPLTYIPTATSIPPFSIAHGDDDCVVDVEQSRLLVGALQEAGQQPQVTILPGAGHMDGRFDAEVLDPTIAWLQQVLGP